MESRQTRSVQTFCTVETHPVCLRNKETCHSSFPFIIRIPSLSLEYGVKPRERVYSRHPPFLARLDQPPPDFVVALVFHQVPGAQLEVSVVVAGGVALPSGTYLMTMYAVVPRHDLHLGVRGLYLCPRNQSFVQVHGLVLRNREQAYRTCQSIPHSKRITHAL